MALFSRRKPNVARLKRRGDLDGLAEALRYRETMIDDDGTEWDLGVEVRVEAARALADLNSGAVADDLAEALRDPQPEVQLAALQALAASDSQVAMEPLVDCVVGGEVSGDVSSRALDLLASQRIVGGAELVVERLLSPDAAPLADGHQDVVERLLDSDPRGPDARRAVAERVIWRLEGPHEEGVDERAERLLGWLGQAGLDRVNETLANGRASPALVRAAGFAGDARAIDSVIDALSSPDPEMRRSAALAAGALKHTQAVPELLGATQDTEQSVRDAASTALNQIGMAAVIVGLASLMAPSGEPTKDGDGKEAVEGAQGEQLPSEATPAATADLPSPAPPSAEQPPWRRRGGLVERLFGRIE